MAAAEEQHMVAEAGWHRRRGIQLNGEDWNGREFQDGGSAVGGAIPLKNPERSDQKQSVLPSFEEI